MGSLRSLGGGSRNCGPRSPTRSKLIRTTGITTHQESGSGDSLGGQLYAASVSLLQNSSASWTRFAGSFAMKARLSTSSGLGIFSPLRSLDR